MEKADSHERFHRVLYVGHGRIVDGSLRREFQRVLRDLSNKPNNKPNNKPKDLDSLIKKCAAKSAEHRK